MTDANLKGKAEELGNTVSRESQHLADGLGSLFHHVEPHSSDQLPAAAVPATPVTGTTTNAPSAAAGKMHKGATLKITLQVNSTDNLTGDQLKRKVRAALETALAQPTSSGLKCQVKDVTV